MDPVVLIADAGQEVGLGHLARASALGAALCERGAAIAAFGLGLDESTERYGVIWQPSGDDSYGHAKVFVLDSYRADDAFRASLRAVAPLVVFNDSATVPDDVDLCVDSGSASALPCLSGAAYACLGPPYWDIVDRKPPSEVRRVLVATGAGDVTDVGATLAAGLRDALPSATVALLRGPAASQFAPDAVELVASQPTLRSELERADLVVCSAGQTMLEALATGVPTVAFLVADNQFRQLDELLGAGAVISASEPEGILEAAVRVAGDVALRRRLSRAGHATIDGRGALRVADAVLALRARGSRTVRLRRATAEDAALLLEWRNDPLTRNFSFTKHEITPAEHRAWLETRLSDADTLLWIATSDGSPIGQVRLSHTHQSAEIHIAVAAACRGRGYARAMIGAAIRSGAEEWPDVQKVVARIDHGNKASIRAFTAAGFRSAPGQDERIVLELVL